MNKTGNTDDLLHNSVLNTHNMVTWRKLYEKSNAKQPECWPDNIKHYGHTISVSDIFFIGHYLGMIEIVTDEIKEFYEEGIVTYNNNTIDADIIIKCTGIDAIYVFPVEYFKKRLNIQLYPNRNLKVHQKKKSESEYYLNAFNKIQK